MTREERLILARELQENPLWTEILEDLRANNIKAWMAEQNPEQREMHWHYNTILGDVALAIKNALNFTPDEE